MAYISNINNIESININNKISKFEDSKKDSYIFRKHIDYSIPNCFISKEAQYNYLYVPTIKQNINSQVEELQKLQSEISSYETKIRELETSKKMKLTKIEDLRKIIERIADEDCFDCVFTTRQNNRFVPRERCDTTSSTSSKKQRFVNARVENSSNDCESKTTTIIDSEETGGETEEGEAAKQDIQCYSSSSCTTSSHLLMPDLLHQCLLFWQENLPSSKNQLKA